MTIWVIYDESNAESCVGSQNYICGTDITGDAEKQYKYISFNEIESPETVIYLY